MRKRIALFSISLMIIAALGVFGLMPLARAQDDDDQQATIDALVEQRFQETLAAGVPEMTATSEAAMTITFEAAVEQAFNRAMTATAEAAGGGASDNAAVEPIVPDAQGVAVAVEVVFEARGEPNDDSMDEAVEVMRRRLGELGVEDYDIGLDDQRITLELPPLVNYSNVITSVQQTGLLEFVDFSGLNDQINDFIGQQIATSANESRRDDVDEDRPEGALMNPLTDNFFQTIVTGGDIRSSEARPGQIEGYWDVVFEFRSDAGETMLDFSSEHVGEPLAIVLDGEVLTVPVIQSPFGTAGGLISGGFNQEQAERLVLQLEVGAMPVTLDVERVRSLTEGAEVVLNVSPTVPGPSPTPVPSPTPDLRPTATRGEVQIAEQVFEHGRIFWVQPTGQLWVMFGEEEGHGEWGVFEDTYADGEPETDPSIVPPEGFYQPERGFGKLWRGNPEIRDRLGWAVTPEFGYVSDYFYQPGGQVVDGTYTPGPGYHVLFTLYNVAIRFNEDTSAWALNTDEDSDDDN